MTGYAGLPKARSSLFGSDDVREDQTEAPGPQLLGEAVSDALPRAHDYGGPRITHRGFLR